MIEIMRWISLGTSLFALGFSSYSCWLSFRQNKRLFHRNMDLLVENVKLRKKNEEYEAEILRLRNLLKFEENKE